MVNELQKIWTIFWENQSRAGQRHIAQTQPMVVLGDNDSVKNQLIDGYLEWEMMRLNGFNSYVPPNRASPLCIYIGKQAVVYDVTVVSRSEAEQADLYNMLQQVFSKHQQPPIIAVIISGKQPLQPDKDRKDSEEAKAAAARQTKSDKDFKDALALCVSAAPSGIPVRVVVTQISLKAYKKIAEEFDGGYVLSSCCRLPDNLTNPAVATLNAETLKAWLAGHHVCTELNNAAGFKFLVNRLATLLSSWWTTLTGHILELVFCDENMAVLEADSNPFTVAADNNSVTQAHAPTDVSGQRVRIWLLAAWILLVITALGLSLWRYQLSVERGLRQELSQCQAQVTTQQSEITALTAEREKQMQVERGLRQELSQCQAQVQKEEERKRQEWATKFPGFDMNAEVSADGRYARNSAGVIRDSNTGLEWYVGPDNDTAWDQAKGWTDHLMVDGGGWRMPSIEELEGLYQKGKGDRNMDPIFHTTGWYVWTGILIGSSEAWGVRFPTGSEPSRYRYASDSYRAFALRARRK